MWFASFFSNEALISISTVQLLPFSPLDLTRVTSKNSLDGEVRAAQKAHSSFLKLSSAKAGRSG